ncbi:MAG TPA: hypothetical protein VEH76_05030 [Methylocystis sp.]|nr:hypothetical protein [Methylocystis sp.]
MRSLLLAAAVAAIVGAIGFFLLYKPAGTEPAAPAPIAAPAASTPEPATAESGATDPAQAPSAPASPAATPDATTAAAAPTTAAGQEKPGKKGKTKAKSADHKPKPAPQ